MKINKSIGALALGLGLATVVQANPDAGVNPIYITGSTAFRGQIFNALKVDMGLVGQQSAAGGNNSFTLQGPEKDPNGLGLANVGTVLGAFCNFSGSAEGVAALLGIAPYNTATYFNSTATTGTFSHTGVDFAFSDVDQNSTPYPNALAGGTYATLTEDQDPSAGYPYTGVAVVPFTFAVNASGATAGIKNIAGGTSQQDFQAMFMASPGTRDQSFFTGVAPATLPAVVAVGRYNLSGTRITAVLDDGGLLSDSLYQWGLGTGTGAGTNVPGLHQGDSSAVAGTEWVFVGSDGYFSGGNVGSALNNSGSLTPAIGYIGWADAQSKFTSGGGAVPITWNGQQAYVGTFAAGATNFVGSGSTTGWNIPGIENGSYQFWSYERMYENTTDLGTAMDSYGQDIILALEHEIITSLPQTAVLESNMKVYRSQDGGQVAAFTGALPPFPPTGN